VEAKVVCFYRRRDISSTLIALADKHATLSVCYKTGPGADNGEEGEMEEEMENPEMVDLPEKLKHQLRHRELFLSRQLESLPATHIRYPAARRVPGDRPASLTARPPLAEGSAVSPCSTRRNPSSPTWSGRISSSIL